MNAKVIRRETIADGLWIMDVIPDSGEVPQFQAGQYAELGFPEPVALSDADADSEKTTTKIVRRAYSIASAPSSRTSLEFFVVRVDDGQLTPKLERLKVGDRLWLGPKIKGKFTLDDVPPNKDLVMVATGTGLAPYVSMLREFGDKPPWHRFVIIHGVRHAHDLAYRDELERAARARDDVYYVPMASREPEGSDWDGLRGRVTTILEPKAFKSHLGFSLDPDSSHVFLCGNPDMIESARALLEEHGFRKHSRRNPGTIHFERYW